MARVGCKKRRDVKVHWRDLRQFKEEEGSKDKLLMIPFKMERSVVGK